jgi:hypothetical protein
MDPATESRPAATISVFLAGLQGGMLGVCWMLLWLGISAEWQRRSFWTAENLMASVFYGGSAIRSDFAGPTLSGMAVYLLLYSLLGAVFAVIVRDRLPRSRVLLASILFSIGWYYISFHLIWKSVLPLVSLLHAERPTFLGHLIYGTFLGRFPVYVKAWNLPPVAQAPVEPPAEKNRQESPTGTGEG